MRLDLRTATAVGGINSVPLKHCDCINYKSLVSFFFVVVNKSSLMDPENQTTMNAEDKNLSDPPPYTKGSATYGPLSAIENYFEVRKRGSRTSKAPLRKLQSALAFYFLYDFLASQPPLSALSAT